MLDGFKKLWLWMSMVMLDVTDEIIGYVAIVAAVIAFVDWLIIKVH